MLKRQMTAQAREIAFLKALEKKRLGQPQWAAPVNGYRSNWLRENSLGCDSQASSDARPIPRPAGLGTPRNIHGM